MAHFVELHNARTVPDPVRDMRRRPHHASQTPRVVNVPERLSVKDVMPRINALVSPAIKSRPIRNACARPPGLAERRSSDDAPLIAIAQQFSKARGVLRRGDDKDVTQSR